VEYAHIGEVIARAAQKLRLDFSSISRRNDAHYLRLGSDCLEERPYEALEFYAIAAAGHLREPGGNAKTCYSCLAEAASVCGEWNVAIDAMEEAVKIASEDRERAKFIIRQADVMSYLSQHGDRDALIRARRVLRKAKKGVRSEKAFNEVQYRLYYEEMGNTTIAKRVRKALEKKTYHPEKLAARAMTCFSQGWYKFGLVTIARAISASETQVALELCSVALEHAPHPVRRVFEDQYDDLIAQRRVG